MKSREERVGKGAGSTVTTDVEAQREPSSRIKPEHQLTEVTVRDKVKYHDELAENEQRVRDDQ